MNANPHLLKCRAFLFEPTRASERKKQQREVGVIFVCVAEP